MDVVLVVLLSFQLVLGVTCYLLWSAVQAVDEESAELEGRVDALCRYDQETTWRIDRIENQLKMERLHRKRSVQSIRKGIASMVPHLDVIEKYLATSEPPSWLSKGLDSRS